MEFSGKSLESVKQEHVYLYEYINSLKFFFEDKLPDRCTFFSSLNGECTCERDDFYAIDVWIV